MTVSRKVKFISLLLAVSLMLCLTGCNGISSLPPGSNTEATVPAPEQETVVPETTEPAVEVLPAYEKELGAVQCYYNGQLQREYVLTYNENGRISVLQIHTYDKGSIYSWGENHYEYDDQGNLVLNDYVYSLGSQRWEYENTYDDRNMLVSYRETEYYNGQLVGQHTVDCFYDATGRYMGNNQPEAVIFDEYGRVLNIQVKIARGDYLVDIDAACDYSCMPVMLCQIHTVYPEYEQFSSNLRVMLNPYHVAFGLDMREGYQTHTDDQGFLTRITDENGSDVFLFIYN